MGFSKWTTEMNFKFISLYREQDVLWRTDSTIYRDRYARNEALRHIIVGMELPELTLDDVKKKIKYLRSTYMVEVNKIEKSRQNGKIYKPCLSWFHEMDSFIKHVTSRRKTAIPQLDSHNWTDTHAVTKTNWDEISIVKTEEIYEEPLVNDAVDKQPESFLSNKGKPVRSIKPIRSKRKWFDSLQCVVKDIKNISEKLDQKQKKHNEYEAFGTYIGVQLQTLLEKDAIVAQDEIQSIITRYKLKKIRCRNDNYSIASVPISHYLNSSQCEDQFHVPPSRYKRASLNVVESNENSQKIDNKIVMENQCKLKAAVTDSITL